MCEGKHTAEKVIHTQEGENIRVKYEIVADSKEGELSYGIAIYLWDSEGNLNDFVKITDITQKIVEIKALFMVLYKYEVTPMTLYDVLDVCLADFDSIADMLK